MKKLYLIGFIFALVFSNSKGNDLDTTFTLDAKADAIFLDSIKEAKQFRNLIIGETYNVNVTGNAKFTAIDSMGGVICLLSNKEELGIFVIIKVGDTLRFEASYSLISFFIVDHDRIDDNSGALEVHLWKGKVTSLQSNNRKGLKTSQLFQNYPNPSNPITTIDYTVDRPSRVCLEIYNTLGQCVRRLIDEEMATGTYSIIWNGKNEKGEQVSSGTYFYRIIIGDFVSKKKMIVIQ